MPNDITHEPEALQVVLLLDTTATTTASCRVKGDLYAARARSGSKALGILLVKLARAGSLGRRWVGPDGLEGIVAAIAPRPPSKPRRPSRARQARQQTPSTERPPLLGLMGDHR